MRRWARSANARIQEITTGAYDQDRLAAFYCDVFGMRIVWRRAPAPDGSRRGLFLSDGYMCLCIQQAGERGGQSRPEGLQGIGIVLDDLEEVDRLATDHGAPSRPTPRLHPDGQGYVDADVLDPIGILVNLTKRGFGTEPMADRGNMPPAAHPLSLPDLGTGIKHIVFEGSDVAGLCKFYRQVFDLDTIATPVGEASPDTGRSLTDGRTVLSFEQLGPKTAEHPRGRLARVGFVVESAQETLRRARTAGAREVSPSEPGIRRPTGDYVVDPVGVRIDIFERATG